MLKDGFALLCYTFANTTYSQFIPWCNDVTICNGTVSSANNNLAGCSGSISFPVKKDDKVAVTFYQSYGMSTIKLQIYYY